MINSIPEELCKEFTRLEEKIANVLITYTKNRTQKPHPYYYKALCGAVKQMFVHTEEVLIDESFKNTDECVSYSDVTFDIRDLEQLGISSYIESRMLRPYLIDILIETDSYFGEKIAIKNGYFEEEPDEIEAITNLLDMAYSQSEGNYSIETGQYSRFLSDVLDTKMKEITSWTKENAEEFFKNLKGLQPVWADGYQWHITSLDLYEWFCLKNNLTFYQFSDLFDVSAYENKDVNFRLAAYALRYPADENKFTELLGILLKHSHENPNTQSLLNLEDEDSVFTNISSLEEVEKLAALAFEYQEQKENPEYHRKLLAILKFFVEMHATGHFEYGADEEQIHKLYLRLCRCLEIPAVSEIIEKTSGIVKKDAAKDSKDLEEANREYRRNTTKWIFKTTLDPFIDCMNPGITLEDLCSSFLSENPEINVSDDKERIDQINKLQNVLKDAFEEKLAKHLAYAVFVRLVECEHQYHYSDEFALKLVIAREFSRDRETYGSLPRINKRLEPISKRLHQEFPNHPLIANQLASKIYVLTLAISEKSSFNPIWHHYFLADMIRHLLNAARDAAGTSRRGRRIVRYLGENLRTYADDTCIVDFLYRSMCRYFIVQPCVNIHRIL